MEHESKQAPHRSERPAGGRSAWLTRWQPRLVPVAAFTLLFVGLIAVNVLAAFLPGRLDVTEQGLYTLSRGSEAILDKLDEPVTLRLYYSQSLETVPVSFKTYSRKVIELLREYEAQSGGMLTLEIYDPQPDTEDEEWATRYGLSPARLPSGTSMYFGLVAIAAEREAAVPFLDPRREKFLEYDISQAISRVSREQSPTVGVLSYLPVGGQRAPMRQGAGEWTVVRELKKLAEVRMLSPGRLVEVPDDVELLLVIHPKDVPERISYAIDQFLLRGGKVMAFVDPNSRLDPGSRARFGAPTNSDLERLFAHWGIGYDPTQIVGDHALATRVSTQSHGVLDFPVWITLKPQYLNRDLAITSDLEEITLIDSGAFETGEDFAYEFTPLLTSSTQSAFVDFSTVRMVNPVTMIQSIEPDGKKRVLSALVTGTFSTAFPDGPPPLPEQDEQNPQQRRQPELPEREQPHVAEGRQESTVVLVGDADFMGDRYSVQTVNFFGNPMAQPLNDNLNFVLNTAEFLLGSQDLIHIRSRGQFSRPFTVVENLRVQATEKFRAEEQRLSDKLDEVKRKLEEIERARGGSGEEALLSQDQLEAVQQYRLEEQQTRRALRDVRRLLREDIDRLGNILLAINLLAVPALVALFGFVVIYRRSVRKGGKP